MSSTYPTARHLYADFNDGLNGRVAEYRAFNDYTPVPVSVYIKSAIVFAFRATGRAL